ncbi:hypothetical protein GCM10011328_00680 [Hafnia psychrotolerans]|uniref:Uncharacterized protein n=1 Tax=Hafnia psychrotolerans TaxID=1477018 RepID=A0ABQ1FT99_9GAMM|nr:hypothetical protein GCM10011328_00680 [Hafnia psychrotolerans]
MNLFGKDLKGWKVMINAYALYDVDTAAKSNARKTIINIYVPYTYQ